MCEPTARHSLAYVCNVMVWPGPSCGVQANGCCSPPHGPPTFLLVQLFKMSMEINIEPPVDKFGGMVSGSTIAIKSDKSDYPNNTTEIAVEEQKGAGIVSEGYITWHDHTKWLFAEDITGTWSKGLQACSNSKSTKQTVPTKMSIISPMTLDGAVCLHWHPKICV